MKKGFVVITICFALSFLVSTGFVSPSFAKQTTQTPSTSKQQTPCTPAAVESAIAKPVFWDLEVGSIFIKGQLVKIGGPNHTVNVKVGETVTFKCTYRMKTLPVGSITQADAKRWGAGLPFAIRMQVHSTKMGIEDKNLLKDAALPKFTYEDVLNWKKNLQPGVGKAWDEDVYFQWTPGAEYVGNMFISVVYLLDVNHVIPEPDEQNNHINTATGILNIVVTP